VAVRLKTTRRRSTHAGVSEARVARSRCLDSRFLWPSDACERMLGRGFAIEARQRTDAGEAAARHFGQVEGEGERRGGEVEAHVLRVRPFAGAVVLLEVQHAVQHEV
jgi:hypothetical protein